MARMKSQERTVVAAREFNVFRFNEEGEPNQVKTIPQGCKGEVLECDGKQITIQFREGDVFVTTKMSVDTFNLNVQSA